MGNGNKGPLGRLRWEYISRLSRCRLDKLSSNGGAVIKSVTLTGTQGERILGVDFRPANGKLYGVINASQIYVIDPETGVATKVGVPFPPAVASTNVGFDFNPVVDRIRIVADNGQNLRVNPNTGAIAGVDGNINGAPGARIAAVAYSNSVAGATSTNLYDIDPATDKLYRQDPPNAGSLVELGSLQLDISGEGGFDAPNGRSGLGLFQVGGKTTLFSVELYSGYSRVLAQYAPQYTAIAIVPGQSWPVLVDQDQRHKTTPAKTKGHRPLGQVA
ncbi:MAG: DUF4394 domain-containing protein [Spirosoma sp.]|nr:DUF4394 domain-containing protein [Spirosoma sp.]